MKDCIFCKIAGKDIPCNIAYEDQQVLAFHDINPQSPVHILIIPKKHIGSILELTADDHDLPGHIIGVANDLARKQGLDRSGFRLVVNYGQDGGQSVPHLHFHVMGGRSMQWPPG